MDLESKIYFNEVSSKGLGWKPEWFGHNKFDSILIKKIKEFQRSHDLKADGLVGPMSYRRVLTEVEFRNGGDVDDYHISKVHSNHIICDSLKTPISWEKTVSLEDEGNLALPTTCYNRIDSRRRKPRLIVIHWDAALSSKSSKNIFLKRKVSTHFSIDNDGTIYQMVDTQNIAWHAREVNRQSIGIDLSNAYYLKYNSAYEERFKLPPRPILKRSVVHGKELKPHLGYYPEQIEALKALLNCLCSFYDIKKQTPDVTTAIANIKKYEGIVCHYHVTKNKIDCAGLELPEIIKSIK